MKPLVATNDMKEGSINESEVFGALPTFFQQRNSAYAWRMIGNENSGEGVYSRRQCMKFSVQFLRTDGLVCSAKIEMLGDSPDGIYASIDECGDTICAAVEIRTMAVAATVHEAKENGDQTGDIIVVIYIGRCSQSDELFRRLVPTTSYSLRCLRHAAIVQVNYVFFCV